MYFYYTNPKPNNCKGFLETENITQLIKKVI